MFNLNDIIDKTEYLELKRAIAVKMFILNFNTKEICHLLNVSDAFVSKWKIIYENKGAGGLKANYHGGQGYLTEDQRYEIVLYLKNRPHYSVEELRDYIEHYYGVVYASKQSYYDLLKEAGLSWHQSQAVNQKGDPLQVEQTREEIKKTGRAASGDHEGSLVFKGVSKYNTIN